MNFGLGCSSGSSQRIHLVTIYPFDTEVCVSTIASFFTRNLAVRYTTKATV